MQVFTIMGIDPGSRNLGVSIFFIDFRTLNIVDIISIPISLNKYNILNTSRTGLVNRLVYLESEAKPHGPNSWASLILALIKLNWIASYQSCVTSATRLTHSDSGYLE